MKRSITRSPSTPTTPTETTTALAQRQESHRVYIQRFAPRSSNRNSSGNPADGAIIATSAAIRLTGMAKCKDVTQLLRKKFGLPPLLSPSPLPQSRGNPALNRINRRLEQVRGSSSHSASSPSKQEDMTMDGKYGEADVLVLVGTLYNLPKNYVQFEHEYDETDDLVDESKMSGMAQQKVTPAPTTPAAAAATPPRRRSSSSGWPTWSSPSRQLSSGDGNTNEFTSKPYRQQHPSSSSLQSSPSRRNAPNPTALPTTYQVSNEPFNIIRTLLPHENPLSVKDEMMHLLLQKSKTAELEMGVAQEQNMQRNKKTPSIRWFFQPGLPKENNDNEMKLIQHIPSFVDVDGYCTTTESDEEEVEEEDQDEVLHRMRDSSSRAIPSSFSPVLHPPQLHFQHASKNSSSLQKERHLLSILSRQESAIDNHCVSGYLLCRSKRDPCVWKRVHCVLTDDKLWYVSRMKDLDGVETARDVEETEQPSLPNRGRGRKQVPRVGKHHVIRLSRSLLIQPSNVSKGNMIEHDLLQLSRAPYSFEICTAKGTSHVFRAKSRAVQLRWIQCLSDRIVQCHENNYMELAELIVSEETNARWGRMESASVSPVLEYASSSKRKVAVRRTEDGRNLWSIAPKKKDGVLPEVMRFGMEVGEYKELCRHVDNLIPKQQNRVVVASSGAITNSGSGSGGRQRNRRRKVMNGGAYSTTRSEKSGGGASATSSTHDDVKPDITPEQIAIVHATWDAAQYIYSKSEQVATILSNIHPKMKNDVKDSNNTNITSRVDASEEEEKNQEYESCGEDAVTQNEVEILQKHIWCQMEEYQQKRQTQRQSRIDDGGNESKEKDKASSTTKSTGVASMIPPMDLFDKLLGEFQSLAVTLEGSQQPQTHSRSHQCSHQAVGMVHACGDIADISAGAVV
mmetsp:Transcript_12942/g.17353  ORF Transcript_12942/g.17353 Transcript_12942/m.17353 type:complete len:907 (+) Transcript_12942:153-2873(+)